MALDDSIKQEILRSFDNITPKKDKTNNIQLKFNLPVSPVIVECELEGEGKDDEEDEIKYKDYFLYSGENLIKFNDLKPNLEYEGECVISSLTFQSTRIKITFGNEKDIDYISCLYPSSTSNDTAVNENDKTDNVTDTVDVHNDSEQNNVYIRCADKKNKMNPICLKKRYNNLYNILETKMPETDVNNEIETFSKLSDSEQMDLLDDIFKNFDEEIEKNDNSTQIIRNIINKEKYLVNIDCSNFANERIDNSLKEIDNKEYKNCRENKKVKQKKIIQYLKCNIDCNYLSFLISKNGISDNVEYNLKYLFLLVEEVTNNADSFNQGDSEVLMNMTTCLQENYEVYWNQVQEYLKEKETPDITITTIKKDISNLLISSIANLVKVLHFDEIDNYISDDEKNITSKGLMASKKGKQIHKSIKQFMKNFNEFGDGLYNLSDSLIINITINDEYKEAENKTSLEEEKVIKYEDQGIILLLKPQSMMKQYNAYAIQLINYDSPLISIKSNNDTNDNVLNTFISITLYDKEGNEIKIDKIPKDIRPKILYDKEYYKYMNTCYFYNEEIEDLSENGVLINDNYTFEGREYLQCTAEHLTCFTAGKYYDNPNISKKELPIIMFIILGGILAVILIIVLIICIVKKVKKKRRKERKVANIELDDDDDDDDEIN